MTQFILHRTNTIESLNIVEPQWGVEIDLRSSMYEKNEIILSHDPWTPGDHFNDWLITFKNKGIYGPLILNTKEDGLEKTIIEILNKLNIDNYFFLDTAVPTLVKWTSHNNFNKFAVRISKYEPVEFTLQFADRVQWVWVDCFDGTPFSIETLRKIKNKFKICMVSPELQGQPLESIVTFKEYLGIADAICTKSPKSWLNFSN